MKNSSVQILMSFVSMLLTLAANADVLFKVGDRVEVGVPIFLDSAEAPGSRMVVKVPMEIGFNNRSGSERKYFVYSSRVNLDPNGKVYQSQNPFNEPRMICHFSALISPNERLIVGPGTYQPIKVGTTVTWKNVLDPSPYGDTFDTHCNIISSPGELRQGLIRDKMLENMFSEIEIITPEPKLRRIDYSPPEDELSQEDEGQDI